MDASGESLALPAALIVVSCVCAWFDWAPAPARPSVWKPHSTFPSFYVLYLSQHRKPLTKLTHAIGTSCFIALCVMEPRLLLGIGAALFVGVVLCPLLRSHDTGAVEGLAFVASYLAVGRAATGSWREVAAAPLSAYFFAWLGHFVFEGNKPATFIYPAYSLLGDFFMLAQLATFQLPWDGTFSEKSK